VPTHTTPTTETSEIDARALVAQLYLDARNQAVCMPTRRLRGHHHRLVTHRRHVRLSVWQTVQLVAAHRVLTERGERLAQVEPLPALYWEQPHA
jgi:hypothetical protein